MPRRRATGVRTTMIAAGVLGAVVTFAALLVPGVRQMDAVLDGAAPSAPSAPRGISLSPIPEGLVSAEAEVRLPA